MSVQSPTHLIPPLPAPISAKLGFKELKRQVYSIPGRSGPMLPHRKFPADVFCKNQLLFLKSYFKIKARKSSSVLNSFHIEQVPPQIKESFHSLGKNNNPNR
uniref:Uncharacterized protein n=1 Tax=Micrurus surinamensis TaxID=129470 RepID=A0A2D4PIK5_MICSU